MPRVAKILSTKAVDALKHPGGKTTAATFAVGGVPGLLLSISASGSRNWILRIDVGGGKRREIGLGSYPAVGLAAARDRARADRATIVQGGDPSAERKAKRIVAPAPLAVPVVTFEMAVADHHEAKLAGFKTIKEAKRWGGSLRLYAIPVIGKMPVADIGHEDVERVLIPIWNARPDLAARLRRKIEAVMAFATVRKHRAGPNPAVWKHNLSETMPKQRPVANHYPAISLDDANSWWKALAERQGMAAQALMFAVLTAARSGEVRGANWSEIDLDAAIWTVPATRMKVGVAHRVPLSPPAMGLLKNLPRMGEIVFPAPRGAMLSDMAVSAVMRRMQEAEVAAGRLGWLDPSSGRPAVPHGLRSTFRVWASERTDYPRELAEHALAHQVGGTVERAYARSDLLERRAPMMADWAQFLTGGQ